MVMLQFILTGIGGLILLSLAELLWREERRHGEGSRKFSHILIGSYIAMWPFYLSWNQIRLISLILLAGVLLTRYLKLFKTIHSVGRMTWGDIFFALSVGLLTFVTHEAWLYAIAVLHMSLADGLAAVIGTKYGHKHSYKVFGHLKSLAGSLTFFAISYVLLVVYFVAARQAPSFAILLFLPIIATAIENVAVFGLDNVAVPLLVAFVLSRLL